MKYLAAYALLALSGKKEVSNAILTKTLEISKPSSEVSSPTPPMMKSTRSSMPSEERLFTSSLLRDRADWAAPLLLHPTRLIRKMLPRRTIKRKSPRRNNNLKRKLRRPLRRKKMLIWEICSVDQLPIVYLNLAFFRLFKEHPNGAIMKNSLLHGYSTDFYNPNRINQMISKVRIAKHKHKAYFFSP